MNDECEAVLWHGPGHQSKTACQLKGNHEVHAALYPSGYATWRGRSAMTGFFDEPPDADETENNDGATPV